MSSLMDFLGQIEKLAFSLAMGVVLIPKTIIKIVLNPTWVRGYIAKEFAESAAAEKAGKAGDKVRFDDYISPVILLLLCSLVPYLGLQFLPDFGFAFVEGQDIQGPAACSAGSACTYKIQGNFLGDYASDYAVQWQCRDAAYIDTPSMVGKPLTDDTYLIASEVTCKWTDAGPRQVYAEVLTNSGRMVNWATRDVDVAAASSAAVVPSVTEPAAEDTENVTKAKAQAQADKAKGIADAVKQNSYLGVVFLLPALLFALVAQGIKRNEENEIVLSAESLKEVFYAQCYYFAPISLAAYAWIYGAYFMTPDDFFTIVLLTGAQLVIFVWFYRVEVHAVKRERKLEHRRQARKLVNWTIFGTLAGTLIGFILFTSPETLRMWSYRLVEWGIVFAFVYSVVIRRMMHWWRNRKNKKEALPAEA
jgi:hypothetical protein